MQEHDFGRGRRNIRILNGIGKQRFWYVTGAAILILVAGYYYLEVMDPGLPPLKGDQVRVGVYQNPPKVYLDDNGKPAGLFIDLVGAVARDEHWRLQFVNCKWQQCLDALAAGRIDLMPDVAYSMARDRRLDFHHIPITHAWSVVLSPANGPPLSLPRLDGLRIAILAGAIQSGAFRDMMKSYDLDYTAVQFSSYPEAFAAVRDGRADAVVSNSYFAAYAAHRYGLRESPVVFDPVALYFATREDDPLGLMPVIDDHMSAWRDQEDSVYYTALKDAMVPVREPVVPVHVRYALFSAAGLLVLFLVISAMLRWQVRIKTRQLQETANRLDHMLRSSPVMLYQLRLQDGGVCTNWVSNNVERLFGFLPECFSADNLWQQLIHDDDRDAVMANIESLPYRGHLVQEYRVHDATGAVRTVRDEMQYLPGDAGQADEIVGSWNDVTESREQAQQLSFLTNYDALTRLPNLHSLRGKLAGAIETSRQTGRPLPLLLIDLDRFKTVNETLGHAVGDAVLREVAGRLRALLKEGDSLARIGGDRFVMLLDIGTGGDAAQTVAGEIIQRLTEPLDLEGQTVSLSLSIGISLYPDDGRDADSLLHCAEAALYDAKISGRNTHRRYSSALSIDQAERLYLENALRHAVGNGELMLYYQPQYELTSGDFAGVEALLRWRHPELGMVSPARFVPVAEEMGIIGEIGAWVLNEAVRQMAAWRAAGRNIPRVGVNLSVHQIDGEVLTPMVEEVLAAHELPAASLELEITESIIMRQPEIASRALQDFRAMGIHVAIDDFGTGYSSLNYLKHLPIDRIKIDQSFVRDIGNDNNSRVICRTIIGLARSLEVETVAEGIETREQFEFLLQEGCVLGQGFLLSPPQPAAQLDDAGFSLPVN